MRLAVAIANARLVTPNVVWENGVLVAGGDGRITALGALEQTPATGTEVVDGRGLTVLPGFLDVHVHGGGGCDTMDATPDALRAICRTHARHGTTGLLLTTMTQSRDNINAALATARTAWEAGPSLGENSGAQVLGVHLEGPYLSPEKPGAQPRQFIRDYNEAEFADWLDAAGGAIKLITLAPERPHSDRLITAARAAGIVVSLGHTDATSEQTKAALEQGARHATHLFNAMPPIHHRAPGPIPVLLADARVRVEIIADGHHIAPEITRMILLAAGAERVTLITDAMAGAGAGAGTYDLGGHAVTVANGRATLADGTLAGSVLTMDRAAANVRAWTKCNWQAVARMTSTNAADEMGWTTKGRLAPGCDADFVLVDDDLAVHATFVAGRCVYRRGGGE